MSKFQAYMALFSSLLPVIKAVENAGMPPGSGKAKLDLVLAVAQVAAAAEPDIAQAITKKEIDVAVVSIVGATVAALNAGGVFNSTPKVKQG